MSFFATLGEIIASVFRGRGGASGGAGASATIETPSPSQADVNEAAGVMTIRACEGTDRPIAYRALYGYHPLMRPDRLFDGFEDHPRRRFWFNGTPVPETMKPAPYTYTTAAGAPQVTETTWNRMKAKYGYRDFSPPTQEQLFRDLIRECGALDDLRAGRLELFVRKCSPVWASLPFSKSGQPRKSMEFVRIAYTRAGGKEEA